MRGCRDQAIAMAREAGAALEELRKSRGLTQGELARAARLHVNTSSNLERGASDPSILVLGFICLALDCRRIDFDERGYLPVPAAPSASPGLAPPPPVRPVAPGCEPAMAAMHGSVVRATRRKSGLGIAELARATGIHPNSIHYFERGLVTPSAHTAFRVYRALGIPYVDGKGGPRP